MIPAHVAAEPARRPAPEVERPPSETGEEPADEGARLAIEVRVVDAAQAAAGSARRPVALEIWTQHWIYLLDNSRECIEVRGRGDGAMDPSRRFVGARLKGGRRRLNDRIEFWQPLPVRGAVAVFEHATAAQETLLLTSIVERIVVRQRVLSMPVRSSEPV
jgi:hypothetical protein